MLRTCIFLPSQCSQRKACTLFKNEFAVATFDASFDETSAIVTNSVHVGSGWHVALKDITHKRMVERIVVMGIKQPPSTASVNGEPLGFTYDIDANVLVIRKPSVSALQDWTIEIRF